jgi:DnaJ-class molecular chaperone
MKTSPHSNGVKTCPDCNGDGVVDKDTDDERQCPTCGGLGFVHDDDKDYEEVIKTRAIFPEAHREKMRKWRATVTKAQD